MDLPDSSPLSDEEKRDAFYHSIMTAVPQVQSVEFMTKNTTGKGLTYEQLKTYIIQNEANKITTTTSSHTALNVQRRDPKDRCFNCDDYGHISRDCTMKGTGLRKCYECNEFVTHKAVECPQRLAQQGRVGRGEMKSTNTYNFASSKRSRGGTHFNNTNRVFKRRFNDSGKENDAKRVKFVNFRARGSFYKNRGSRQQNNWASKDKKNSPNTDDSRIDKGKALSNTYFKNCTSFLDKKEIGSNYTTMRVVSDYDAIRNKFLARFVADSGATEHLTNSKLIFKTFDEANYGVIKCANKDSSADLRTEGAGSIDITTNDGRIIEIDNVRCAETLSENLLSLRRFADLGLSIYLDNEKIDIFDPISNESFISGIYKLKEVYPKLYNLEIIIFIQ